MLRIDRHSFTPAQIARWLPPGTVYIEHHMIGENPAGGSQTTVLEGDAWLPGGLPAGAEHFAAAGPDGLTIIPLDGGHATIGTGSACFDWADVAVLDTAGDALWSASLPLGVKQPHDVWTVTVAADPTA